MALFEPLSESTLNDPYPVYAALRRGDPVHWHDQLQAWVVSRYEDCVRIMSDHETFRSDFRVIGEETPAEFLSLQTLDLPDHGIVRKAILGALRAIDLTAWLAESSAVAAKLIPALDPDGFDFITEFVEPLAAHSMCELFGLPLLADEQAFRSAQRDLVLSMDSGLDPGRREAGMRARRHLSQLILPWVDDPPAAGLIGRVDFASVGDRREFLINSLRAIFVAGYSSSSSALGNAVRVMAERDLLAVENAVELTQMAFHELVRFEGAVQAESRAVAADAIVGGRQVRAGDIVVVLVGSANRDSDVFKDAGDLCLDRAPNPHLGFGRGIHACIGTRLALMLGVGILNQVLGEFRLRLTGSPVQRPTATLRGLDALPVSVERRQLEKTA